jgi:hypothetical protein
MPLTAPGRAPTATARTAVARGAMTVSRMAPSRAGTAAPTIGRVGTALVRPATGIDPVTTTGRVGRVTARPTTIGRAETASVLPTTTGRGETASVLPTTTGRAETTTALRITIGPAGTVTSHGVPSGAQWMSDPAVTRSVVMTNGRTPTAPPVRRAPIVTARTRTAPAGGMTTTVARSSASGRTEHLPIARGRSATGTAHPVAAEKIGPTGPQRSAAT